MTSGSCSSTNSNNKGKRYKGIRMRTWGKWVAEIREPNKPSRIWLGSYSSPIAAARAYDIALFYLRGPTAKLNFPEKLEEHENTLTDISAASIRKRAAEVGARVDAMESLQGDAEASPGPVQKKRNLNLHPTAEASHQE